MEQSLSVSHSDSSVLKKEKGFTNAVILLDPPNPLTGDLSEKDPHSPALTIAGLPWLKRTLLALQKGGILRIFIVSETPPKAFVPDIERDPRLKGKIIWLQQNQTDIMPYMGIPQESCLVIGLGIHIHWTLIKKLSDINQTEDSVLVIQNKQDGNSFFPFVRMEGTRVVAFSKTPDQIQAQALPIFTLPYSEINGSFSHLPQILEKKFLEKKISTYCIKPEDLCFPLQDEQSVKKTEQALFQSIAGSLDGWVDTYINRPISKQLTKGFLKTPLTPNGITVLSFFIGLLSSAFFTAGGYINGIVGAVLFQFSSTLDCCDGEVARLKYLESPFGKWLDIVLDNVVHILIFSGITWAAVRQAPHQGYLVWGIFALIGVFLSFLLVTRYLFQEEKTGLPKEEKKIETSQQKRHALISNLANRDFSVVILLFALIGKLPWLLILVGIGSNLYAFTLLGLSFQGKKPS